MEVSSSHQIYVFLLCVLSGIVCGAFFDVQRFLRKLYSASNTRTMLEDILFGCVCIGVMIGCGLFFNNGEMRYYQVMGSVSGALLYASLLSRLFMKLLNLLFYIVKTMIVLPVVKICVFLMIPVKKLVNVTGKLASKAKRKLFAVKRDIKKRKKWLKKRIKML